MLLIGMLAWFVRYAMFALGVSEEGRVLLYLGILLHGVCYDFFFVVGFIYTDRVAGEKVKGQAQSMIVMFTYGIGMLLGSQISGALYNRLVAGQTVPEAWVTFWWIPAVAAAVIALIFFRQGQFIVAVHALISLWRRARLAMAARSASFSRGLVGDIVGRLFREFAVTLAVAILISAVVSLTLTPMMCARMLSHESLRKQNRFSRASERLFERVIAASSIT
jgi:hypothetical protein